MVTGRVLKDRYFFPLAALLIAAIVVVALLPGGASDDPLDPVWELAGEDLRALQVSPGTTMEYRNEDGGYVELSSFTSFDEGPGSVGIFAALGPAQERNFAGAEIEITLRARAARRNPLDEFETAYFPIEAPASAWQNFTLGPAWEDYSFRFTPPLVAADPNSDLISIWPGKAGRQEGMELALVRVTKIAP